MKKITGLLLGASLVAFAITPAMAAEPTGGGTGTPAAVTGPSAIAPPAADTTLMGPRMSPAAPPSGAKIGFVDMAKVASDSVPGKAAASEMKTRAARLRNQMQSREKQLSKQKAAIESTIASLSPAQREAKAKEFQKKIEAYQKFAQKAGKEIQARNDQLLSRLYQATQKAAEEHAKANGYMAVVIKKELLYVSDTVEIKDLTEEVIKLLDRKPGVKK